MPTEGNEIMTMTEERLIGRIELNSSCHCTHCESCGIGYMGEEESCLECSGPLTDLTYGCGGECWEDANYAAEELFSEYLKEMEQPKRLRIEGKRMGWQSRSGHKDIRATWEALKDALIFDGDLRLELKVEAGGIFTARRWSHDEPMGASFSIYPIQLLADTMTLDEAITAGIVDEWGCHKGCGEYFPDCECVREGENA